MASESVLKIVVDDKEYNASLKQAQQGLQALEKALGNAGESFDGINKSVLDYTRAIGKMDAQAKTAKGRIGEMSNAFVELSSHYNRLTDAEKRSPFGQALSESLKELKTRIHDSTNELHEIQGQLQEVSTEANDSGGILDALSKKVTLNVDAFKLLDLGLGAVSSALGVAKDAFFNNEQNLDDWGRTVASSESLYKGFLNALNTGDISGYLSNIDNIVNAARAAYDAMDELNTFNAFNQINNQRARTNLQNAINDFREGSGSMGAVSEAGATLRKELRDRQKRERAAYEAAVGRVAAERGVSSQDLLMALSGTYGRYQDLKAVMPTGRGIASTPGGMFGGSVTYEYKFAQTQQEKLGEALRHLNDTELQSLQALGAQAENTGYEIESVNRQLIRVGRQADQQKNGNKATTTSGKSGGGGTAATMFAAGSVGALTQEMRELQAAQRDAINTTQWQEYQQQIDAITQKVKELKGELGLNALSNEKGISMSSSINDTVDSMQKSLQTAKPNTQMVENVPKEDSPFIKGVKTTNEVLSQVNTGISSMVQGIEGLGIEIPRGMSTVISFLQSITLILTSIEAFNKVSTMLGLFSHGGVVKAAGGYRVPGTAFSGDMVPARLNAGEVVLNQAQAGVIASNLQGQEFSGGVLQPYTDGEQIYLGVETMLKRKGKGEIVTTSMLRQMGLIQ